MSGARYPEKPVLRPWTPMAWFTLAMNLAWLILTSWILAIGLELVGMYFEWWDQPGSQHAETMLTNEIIKMSDQFNTSSADNRLVRWAGMGRELAYQYSGMAHFVQWLASSQPSSIPLIDQMKPSLLSMADYLLATAYITQLIGVRAAVVILSFPVFIFMGMIGVIDGLVQRDLRRFGGGSESSFMYHQLKPALQPMVWLPIMIYLTVPWSLHPTLVFVPPALLFGWFLRETIARFKKYL